MGTFLWHTLTCAGGGSISFIYVYIACQSSVVTVGMITYWNCQWNDILNTSKQPNLHTYSLIDISSFLQTHINNIFILFWYFNNGSNEVQSDR